MRAARPTPRPRRRARYPLAAFLFDDQDRLLPAVLRRDGAAAAHGRRPGARGLGLQPGHLQPRAQRLRRPRHRRPLVGRGVLPALRLGHVRPDARRLAGALAARRQRRSPNGGPTLPPNSAAAWASRATARSPPATRAPTSRPTDQGGGWRLPVGARRGRRSGAAGGVLLWRRRTPFVRTRPSSPSSSARCTAPAATRRPTTTLARLEGLLGGSERGRRLRARAARPPLRARDGAADARAAPRAAPRARRGPRRCAGACAPGGRCRRCRSAPSRIVVAGRTLRSRHGQRVRPVPERDPAPGERRLPRRRRPAGARPRPRARQGLDPRGARPRAVRRPALPRGRRGVRGGRRARADQRLRAVLPRALAAAPRPPRRGAPAARARVEPAPGARGLPHVPRPARAATQPEGAVAAPAANDPRRCYARSHSFRGRPPAGCSRKWALARFFIVRKEER